MKVAICSKYSKEKIIKILHKKGFKLVKREPDLVISYGGDGTILYAENKYPNVPKLVIKTNSRKLREYEYDPEELENKLEKIRKQEYSLVEEMKLKAKYKCRILEALNEIQVRNKLLTKAIRFSLEAGNKAFEELCGDGIIIATPFGSTGYYNSTGGKPFKKGVGLAFNNLHLRDISSKVLPEGIRIKVRINKGDALLIKDNDEKFIKLSRGDQVNVKKSNNNAMFIKTK
ncbi:MAG TPA: NAD(+)/NADH kinase [Candidatus Woesearchaeota archaeon]|nr:NAD(+)/NADH kinase [Candidatus Woesearchaeota archaeon]